MLRETFGQILLQSSFYLQTVQNFGKWLNILQILYVERALRWLYCGTIFLVFLGHTSKHISD